VHRRISKIEIVIAMIQGKDTKKVVKGSRKPKAKKPAAKATFIDLVVGGDSGDKVAIELPGWRPAPKQGMIKMANGGVLSPSKKDMARFAIAAKIACPPPPHCPLTGALVMTATFSFRIPPNIPAGMTALPIAGDYMIETPDLDNLVKFIGDAMTGIYYEDDRQLGDISVKKVWGAENGCSIRLVKK
jgi:Holliday junction resolvase RusA-like endonuclease